MMKLCLFHSLLILCAVLPPEYVAAGEFRSFPSGLPKRSWVEFEARGFTQPVCGLIHDFSSPPSDGMPLGGIDTGCIDLEGSGLWGYCTIFNTMVPRRGPINLPFLGLSVGGRTWILADPNRLKVYEKYATTKFEPVESIPAKLHLYRDGLRSAKNIEYWGHYPVVDLEFETDSPIQVGLRAWSPFLPGVVEESIVPGFVLEVHLRNVTETTQEGSIAFSFPGPTFAEAGAVTFERSLLGGPCRGVEVSAPRSSYTIAAIGQPEARVGGDLGADPAAWSKMGTAIPPMRMDQAGSSVAVDFKLARTESQTIRFVLTWVSPQWKGGGHPASPHGSLFTHMYSQYYARSSETASFLAKEHERLLDRILAWQQIIYSEETLPVWLRESLVNNLALLPEVSVWAAAKPPIPSWVRQEDGLFGMNESPRDCPQTECLACSFYGNQPLVYFFPRLALSSLRGYKGFQRKDGAAVWIWGGGTESGEPAEIGRPSYEYQDATNGISLASMVDRFLLCWGTPDLYCEFYEQVKQNTIYTMNLRPEAETGERIISMPSGNRGAEWFEAPEPGWSGMVTHIGGLHLAQVLVSERLARNIGDTAFSDQCAEWYAAGSRQLELMMWNGNYYLNFWEPQTGKKSDLIFGYQLDGQWVARHHGFPGVFQEDRVKMVLDTLRKCNASHTEHGILNYANPDGTVASVAGYGPYNYFPPELLMVAMTYIYEGQRDYGLSLAERCWEHLVCRKGFSWDLPNLWRADTDERSFGHDYYQCMMLWSLPAALAGQDFSGPCKEGGLTGRVVKAAKCEN